MRIRDLVERKCKRHISSQLIEDGFNSVKRAIDQRSNSVATPSFAMSKLLDNHVLENKYSFKEVQRISSLDERNVNFAADTWTPTLQKKSLHPALAAAQFSSVAGFQEPTWFSPGASGYLGPLADIEAARQADAGGKLELLGFRDYCRLVHKGIMLKRADAADDQWLIGMGNCDGAVAVAWPAKQVDDAQWVPDLSKSRVLLTIINVDEWVAMPIEWISPLHRAILIEMEKQGKSLDQEVKLRPSHEYGVLHMTGRVMGAPRPLWQLAAHFGFWNLPLNFLRQLCARRGIELAGTTLLTTLESMYVAAHAGCTSEDIIHMLDRRGISFEHSMCHVGDLLAMEELCDQFDKGFSEQPIAECKEARIINTNFKDFTTELMKYKAFPACWLPSPCRDALRVCSFDLLRR